MGVTAVDLTFEISRVIVHAPLVADSIAVTNGGSVVVISVALAGGTVIDMVAGPSPRGR